MKNTKVIYFNIADRSRNSIPPFNYDDAGKSIFKNLLMIAVRKVSGMRHVQINPIMIRNTICFEMVETNCYMVTTNDFIDEDS